MSVDRIFYGANEVDKVIHGSDADAGRLELTWNGVSSYGSIDPIGMIGLFTINFDFEVKSFTSANNMLIGISTDANGYINVSNSGILTWASPGGSGSGSAPAGTILLDTPYHLEVVKDAVDLRVWLNGDLVIIVDSSIANLANFDRVAARDSGPRDFIHTIMKNLHIDYISAGEEYFWALDSGSIVSEESTLDSNTLVFNNVDIGDWSQETLASGLFGLVDNIYYGVDAPPGERLELEWNGIDSFGEVTQTSNTTALPMLIEFEVNADVDNLTGNHGILGNDGASYVRLNANSNLIHLRFNNADQFTVSGTALTSNQWHKFKAEKLDANNWTFYFDDVEVDNYVINNSLNFYTIGVHAAIFGNLKVRNLHIIDPQGVERFWAIDSGSIASEESIPPGDPIVFNNVDPGDWSGAPDYGDSFVSVWRTFENDETVTLPATGVNNFEIDWGDGTVEQITDPNPSHEYANFGDHEIRISGTCPAWFQNAEGDALKLIRVEQLGIVGWLELTGAFRGCDNLQGFASRICDTTSVTSFFDMFRNTGLANANLTTLDTINVTTFNNMFLNSSIANIDVSFFDIDVLGDANDLMGGTQFSTENYDKLLVAWEPKPRQNGIRLGVGSTQYSAGAPADAKAALEADGWEFIDGGPA